ncbi:hypothetical protein Pan97_24930 [Bremerella volcania]|uniref:Uncharacterized protein n=1 Tax=Bremerella volcania TaxID=2527984 RepID=A0A518C8B3_9BACT|nr:hypothetical protein [Bremerella volcania]QDU75461.1 hypothetical protein Pan97_24930 [Bremerella volcania]
MTTNRSHVVTRISLILALVWLALFNAAIAFWACVPQTYWWPLLAGHALTLGVVVGGVRLPHWLRWFLFAISMFYFRYASMQSYGGSDISLQMLMWAILITTTAMGTILLMWVTFLLKAELPVRARQYSIRQILLLIAGIAFALAAWLPYVSAMPVIIQRFKESHTDFRIYEMMVLASVGLALPLTVKTRWGKLVAGIITCAFILIIPNSQPFAEL